MAGKTEVNQGGPVEPVEPQQPGIKIGTAVLEKLRIERGPDANRVALVGQAAVCTYFLRMAALGMDVSHTIKAHLRGEKQSPKVDLEKVVASSVNQITAVFGIGSLPELLGVLSVYSKLTAKGELSNPSGGPERSRWMIRRVEEIASLIPTKSEVPKPAPVAEAPEPTESTQADAGILQLNPSHTQKPEPVTERPPRKAAAKTQSAKVAVEQLAARVAQSKKAAPKAVPVLANTAGKAEPIKAEPAKAMAQPASAPAGETMPKPDRAPVIEEFADLPEPYASLTLAEAVDGLALLATDVNMQRNALVEYLAGTVKDVREINAGYLLAGLEKVRTLFIRYQEALDPELVADAGFVRAWNIATGLIFPGRQFKSYKDVAITFTNRKEVVARAVMASLCRRVLHLALTQHENEAHAAKVLKIIETVSRLRRSA